MVDDTDPEIVTTTPAFNLSVSGLHDPKKAEEFARLLGDYVHALGTALDLSRLAGMTVSDNYVEALTQVERGFETPHIVTRSENENMVGMAMCVQVLHDDVPMVHLVCEISMLIPLYACEPGSDDHKRALQMLAHECAHIEDLKRKDDAFPGVLLKQKVTSFFEAHFGPVALSLWQEYYACRRTAHFCRETGDDFAQVLVGCLDTNQKSVNEAIIRYRDHQDLDRLVVETFDPATRAIRIAAYLIGHLDGLGEGLEIVPDVANRLDGTQLGELIEEIAVELRRLWDMRNEWTGMSDLDNLADLVCDTYAVAGVIATELPDGGAHLDVPYSTATV